MTYKRLEIELQNSIKSKNKVRKNAIADIVTNAKNAAIAKKEKDQISEETVAAAILKSKKSCQEQIDTCPAERADLLALYKETMSYIDEFAPTMMNEEEIRAEVHRILATANIHENNKGAVMKAVMPHLKGKADGKLINTIVTEILNKAK